MSLATPTPTDLARAQAILARPAAVHMAGSRLATARRWTAAVLRNMAIVLVFAPLGGGIISGLTHVGVLPEIVARLAPAHPTAAAPEKIQWAALPTSPLVEAGRLENGALSLDKMLRAWRDAGMSSHQAPDALAHLAHLRPVLLGRDDPALAAQLHAEARAAVSGIEQAFPLVLERLRTGQSVAVDAHDRQQWARVMADLRSEAMVAPPALEYSLAHLVARAQVNQDHPAPLSPLLEAGFDAAGQWSAQRMIAAWQQAGMHPLNAASAVEDLRRTVVDLEGLSPHLASQELDLAQSAMENLVMGHWLVLSRLSGQTPAQVGAQVGLYNLPEPTPGPELSPHEARQVWDEALATALAGEQPLQVPEGLTMDQARKALAQAVSETGLRAVSLEWGQWESPASAYRVARHLSRANAELSRATGLPGKVLGLDGRVELAFGKPQDNPGADGVVLMDRAGRLQMVTGWQEMAHEWWHAFDHTASRATMAHSTVRPLSENIHPLRAVHAHAPFNAMDQLDQATKDQAPRWHAAREDAAANNRYWTRPSEVLAFGFSAVLQEQGQIQVLADPDHRQALRLEPARGPLDHEARALWPSYQAIFHAASALHLTQSPPVDLGPIALARQARTASATTTAPLRQAAGSARRPTIR